MTLTLVVMAGLPGVGKSAIAERIASEFDMVILSVDPIESAIIQAGIPQSFETGLAAYLVAEALAKEQLALARSIVIDAVNPVEAPRAVWRTLASQTGAKLRIVECVCSDLAEHRRRVENRHREIPGFEILDWARVQSTLAFYEPWEDSRLIIETSGEVDWLQIKNHIES